MEDGLERVRTREPIFNVPGVVLGVIALLVAVHVARSLLSPDTDEWLLYAAAFIPARFQGYASEFPGGEVAVWTSWLTHMLLHGDATHLAINSAWLLAFGSPVAERVGSVRFLAFVLLTGFAGAAAFLFAHPATPAAVVGASGAVAGLMGGTMRFLFSALDDGGLRALRERPREIRLMTLGETLRDRRMQLATAAFVILNLLAIVGFSGGLSSGQIAWEAHLGGYFAGLLTFGLFDLPSNGNRQPTAH